MRKNRCVLSFAATSEQFKPVFDELRDALRSASLPQKTRYNAEVVFEEIVTNIIRHGGENRNAPQVEVQLNFGTDATHIIFSDDGPAFDPQNQPEPQRYRSLDDAKIGGLGISLARKASSSMKYERTPQHRNRLTVCIDHE